MCTIHDCSRPYHVFIHWIIHLAVFRTRSKFSISSYPNFPLIPPMVYTCLKPLNHRWDSYWIGAPPTTVRCRYDAIFSPKSQQSHRIPPLRARYGMSLVVSIPVYILLQALQCCLQYFVSLDRVITSLRCISKVRNNHNEPWPCLHKGKVFFNGFIYLSIPYNI